MPLGLKSTVPYPSVIFQSISEAFVRGVPDDKVEQLEERVVSYIETLIHKIDRAIVVKDASELV